MGLDTSAAAARLARQIGKAEASIDTALLDTLALMATMVEARANPELPVHIGQAELVRLNAVHKNILEGGSNLFRVHDGLANIARERAIVDEPGLTQPSGLLNVSTQEAQAA